MLSSDTIVWQWPEAASGSPGPHLLLLRRDGGPGVGGHRWIVRLPDGAEITYRRRAAAAAKWNAAREETTCTP